MWIWYFLGVIFLTAASVVFAKCSLRSGDSAAVSFIRTLVIAVFYWSIVIVNGSFSELLKLDSRSVMYLILIGIAAGFATLFFFAAMKKGEAHKVAAVDELSVIFTVILSYLIFGEAPQSAVVFLGLLGILIGVYLIVKKGKIGVWELIATVVVALSLMIAYHYFAKSYGLYVKIAAVVIMIAIVLYLVLRAIKIRTTTYVIYALVSALFTSLTVILSRIGVSLSSGLLINAIKNLFALFIILIVLAISKKWGKVKGIRGESLLFVILSGLSVVGLFIVSDKLSAVAPSIANGMADEAGLVAAVLLCSAFLKEKLSIRSGLGLILILVGSLVLSV